MVVAAEAESLLAKEKWDLESLSPDPAVSALVAVHPKGLPRERPGLGANLLNAVRYIMEETKIPVEGTIVSKMDGNCWIPPHFFSQLEHAWSTMDDTLCFQTIIWEIDVRMEEYRHLSWFLRAVARVAACIHTVPTHVFPLCGFHSSFCVPLRMICRTGNWDPWMIQEDNLMLQRAVLASNGHIKLRLLRASVYNAPTLTFMDWLHQRDRCITHGWFALGFVLCNIGRLRRAPLTAAAFLLSVCLQMAMSVCLFGFPLMCVLNAPAELWSQQTNMILGATMQVAMALLNLSIVESKWRIPEALITGIFAILGQALLYFLLSLKFLFVSDASQSYKTSGTLASVAPPASPITPAASAQNVLASPAEAVEV